MKGRNNKLTGLCTRRIHEALGKVGIRHPFALWLPDTLPIAEKDYTAFAEAFAQCVLHAHGHGASECEPNK